MLMTLEDIIKSHGSEEFDMPIVERTDQKLKLAFINQII